MNNQIIEPMHPGEFLYKTYIEDGPWTIANLSDKTDLTVEYLTLLINKETCLHQNGAYRFYYHLGRSEESWMQMQYDFDEYHKPKPFTKVLEAIDEVDRIKEKMNNKDASGLDVSKCTNQELAVLYYMVSISADDFKQIVREYGLNSNVDTRLYELHDKASFSIFNVVNDEVESRGINIKTLQINANI